MKLKTMELRCFTLLALTSALLACSKDGLNPLEQPNSESFTQKENETPFFRATLTEGQEANLRNEGRVFLPSQEKNSWQNNLASDVPSRWGVMELPPITRGDLRAAGVWGSYPGRYWSMVRIKTGALSERSKELLNEAILQIESKTNVRFYNSQKDPEYAEPYHFKLPNVYVREVNEEFVKSGSFGMTGGEQYIDIPRSFAGSDEELTGYLMHAICNAAGMFNEVQRMDRDEYVDIFWGNIPKAYHWLINKIENNYTYLGYFDYNSITMPHSKRFSMNGGNTFLKKGGALITKNLTLSELDIDFLNKFYIPYIARTDLYTELDSVVYMEGRKLSEAERVELQKRLNEERGLYGEPPIENRIEREPW